MDVLRLKGGAVRPEGQLPGKVPGKSGDGPLPIQVITSPEGLDLGAYTSGQEGTKEVVRKVRSMAPASAISYRNRW